MRKSKAKLPVMKTKQVTPEELKALKVVRGK